MEVQYINEFDNQQINEQKIIEQLATISCEEYYGVYFGGKYENS